jgi:5'-nucleotidase
MAEGEMPPGITLNVNVPSVPRGEIRGIAVTRLSPISYWRLRTEQGGDGLYYNKLSAIAADHPDIVEGTDVWALNRGLISITPLRLEVTDDTQVPALTEHTSRLESALERMLESP